MFKFKQNIANVSNYSISIYGLVTEKKKILFLNDFEIDENVLGHISHGDSIFSYHEVSGKVVTKKYNNGGWEKLDFPLGSPFLDKSIYLIQSELESSRKKWTYFLYDIKAKEKIFHSKEYYFFGYPLRKKENLFHVVEDLKTIKNLHLATETTLWQYDTSVLGIEKIGKILGVFGEVLVVVGTVNDEIDTYFPKKDLIFGLDVSSGKVLWKTQTAENYEVNNINGLHYGLKPFKEETIVRALGGNHYFELDTQNGRIQATSLQEQLTLLGLKYLQSSDISSTHLFFKSESSQGHGLDNCIGSFNYETKKIDWHHVIDELSETGTTIKNGEPKASANKIYALDNNNTLHIFERVL